MTNCQQNTKIYFMYCGVIKYMSLVLEICVSPNCTSIRLEKWLQVYCHEWLALPVAASLHFNATSESLCWGMACLFSYQTQVHSNPCCMKSNLLSSGRTSSSYHFTLLDFFQTRGICLLAAMLHRASKALVSLFSIQLLCNSLLPTDELWAVVAQSQQLRHDHV